MKLRVKISNTHETQAKNLLIGNTCETCGHFWLSESKTSYSTRTKCYTINPRHNKNFICENWIGDWRIIE